MPSFDETDAAELSNRLEAISNHHELWRSQECLNLMASENITSKRVRRLLSSDLGHRYTSRDGFYRGTRFIDEIESMGVDTACKLFGSKYADIRPTSGHLCNLAIMLLFLENGSKMLCIDPEDGGYPGISKNRLSKFLGVTTRYFPFDTDRMNINAEKANKLIAQDSPDLILFGSSFILFPQPIRDLSFKSSHAVYDASHVLGLIAGGKFQDPLREGCNTMIASTHKSFFGPQGGIIISNDDSIMEVIRDELSPSIVDNAHWNRILAMTLALIEMLRFGEEYSDQVIKNSKYLAKTLDELGIPVKCREYGYTESHQVILDFGLKSAEISKRLEKANIIVDAGIRLGTSEVTRRGMKEEEMEEIAHHIHDVVTPSSSKDKERVTKFVSKFQDEKYVIHP